MRKYTIDILQHFFLTFYQIFVYWYFMRRNSFYLKWHSINYIFYSEISSFSSLFANKVLMSCLSFLEIFDVIFE